MLTFQVYSHDTKPAVYTNQDCSFARCSPRYVSIEPAISGANVQQLAASRNATAAVNFGYIDYREKEKGAKELVPTGLVVKDGAEISPPSWSRADKVGESVWYGVFYIDKQGKAGISYTLDRQIDGKNYPGFKNSYSAGNCQCAIECGPILVIDGKASQKLLDQEKNDISAGKTLNSANRAAIMVFEEGTVGIACTKRGMTRGEFATYIKETYNPKAALMLDGGPFAGFYSKENAGANVPNSSLTGGIIYMKGE